MRKNYAGRVAGQDYRTAVAARPALMLAAIDQDLKQVPPLTLNIYKQVEMYKNYRPFVPVKLWIDPLYQKPSEETLRRVKEEKKQRKEFRGKLKNFKQAPSSKENFKKDLEIMAFEGGSEKEENKKGAES